MNKRNKINSALVLSLQIFIVGGGLIFWEVASNYSKKVRFFFSQPSAIIGRVWEWFSEATIWKHISVTLQETLYGFAGGVLIGLLLAFLCYRSGLAERVLMPFFNVANAMPRLVFGPIFVLWFGLGMASKVVLGISIIIFIVFFSTFQGLREVDQNLINKVRLLGGTERDVLLNVLIPSALSWVFTSLRTSVGFALVGAVVGEYMSSTKGVGHLIQFAEGMFDSTGVFAGLVVLSVMVVFINYALEKIEARFTGWQLQ